MFFCRSKKDKNSNSIISCAPTICGQDYDFFMNRCFGSAIDLLARLFMASIFWQSGMLKLAYLMNNDFDTLVFLFKDGYALPFPETSVFLIMLAELGSSILLAFGLFGRFAATILLLLTGVIEYSYISHVDHIYWALILCFLIARGSGKVSLDYIWCMKKAECAVAETKSAKKKSKKK